MESKILKNKEILFIPVMIILSVVFTFAIKENNVIKKITGSVYNVPVNDSFKDPNFYSCVIHSYNKEHDTNHKKNYKLSDEELKSIKELECGGQSRIASDNSSYMVNSLYKNDYYEKYKEYRKNTYFYNYDYVWSVNDTSGIEKLTNITFLSLGASYGTVNIDLSTNTKLKNVFLSGFTGISGIEYLGELEKLHIVNKSGNDSSDIAEKIKNPKRLEVLAISGNVYFDMLKFNRFENLKEFIFDANVMYENNDYYNDFSNLKLDKLEYLELPWFIDYSTIPKMPNLKTLVFNKYNDDIVDFDKFPNIESLVVARGDFSKFKNINNLNNLKYLDVYNATNVSGVENFINLRTLLIQNAEFTKKLNSLENIYCNSLNDFSFIPNLKEFVSPSALSIETTKNAQNIQNLEIFISYNINGDFIEDILNFPNLKIFISNYNLSNKIVQTMPNLEILSLDPYGTYEEPIDITNLKNLKQFVGEDFICNKNLENVLKIYSKNDFEQEIDFSLFPNLNYLDIQFNNDKFSFLNISKNINLESLKISGKLSSLDVTNNSSLKYLYLNGKTADYLNELDLSNNKNLRYVDLYYLKEIYENSDDLTVMLKDKEISLRLKYKFPENIVATSCNVSSPSVASCENETIYSKGVGQTNVSYTLENISTYPNTSYNNISMNLVVGQIKFNNINYSEKLDYIFTDKLISEKQIINDIQDNLAPIYAYVDKNNLNISYGNELLAKYKIIKPRTSYIIKENNIMYHGKFDEKKFDVTNATFKVDKNKLKIIYNNKVIKEYGLKKHDILMGDVNLDGKVDNKDLEKQLEHVTYNIELEDKSIIAADLNYDGDVTISDVSKLYKYLNKKISSLGSDTNE